MEQKRRRTQKQLNSFKIAGTLFDRRMKLTLEQRDLIKYLYLNRKELNLKVYEIESMFSIHKGNMYRYINHNNWLVKANQYSKTYQGRIEPELLSKAKKKAYKSLVDYKNKILDVVEKINQINFSNTLDSH